MRKKARLVGVLCVAAMVPGSAAVAAPDTAGCSLSGAAHFTAPLTTVSIPTSYSFHADLTNCSGSSATPAGGTVSAGEPLTIAGIAYRAPTAPSGNASCVFTTFTTGNAIIRWTGGDITVVGLSTTDVGLLWTASVTVLPDITLTQVQLVNGKTVTKTFATNRFNGYSADAVMALKPGDPTGCNGAGVSDFDLAGGLAFAKPS